ncbi:MAG: ABC transporter transmembrane domain-containing protein, partial [Candidatus Methylomirabilales bacterium]
MKSLIPYLIPYRKELALGVFCLFLTNGFALAIPWLLKEAIDHLKGPTPFSAVPRYALLLVAFASLQGFFRFLARRKFQGTAREVEYELRNRLFWHLLQLPSAFFQRAKMGDLMARATQDVNIVRTLLGAGIMYSANTLLVYTSTLALMASIDPSLTLFALLPSSLLFLALTHLKRRIRARFQEVQEQFTNFVSRLQENLSGIRVVKAYAIEDQEVEAFDRLNQAYVEK